MSDYFIHPAALVDTKRIGKGTRIWAFAHVMVGARIGENCNIGDHVFIESGVRVGNGVTIKNGVLLWKGVEIGDFAFLGPGAVFTNDLCPRSPRLPLVKARYTDEKAWLVRTIVEEGASIGANATILCGNRIGKYSLVAAGSVVARNVKPFQLVAGNPAKAIGWVDRDGAALKRVRGGWVNPRTGARHKVVRGELVVGGCRVLSRSAGGRGARRSG